MYHFKIYLRGRDTRIRVYLLSPSNQLIIYEMYVQHLYHNFVISNIRVNLLIIKFVEENINYAVLWSFFLNFIFQQVISS